MIPFSEIEMNGLKFNDCIDITLTTSFQGYKKFYFNGFETANVIHNGFKQEMITHIIITVAKSIPEITQVNRIKVPIDNVESITINE